MIPNLLKPNNHNRYQINSVLSAGGLVFEKTKRSYDFPKSVQQLTNAESRFDFSLRALFKYDSKYVNTRQPQSTPNQ